MKIHFTKFNYWPATVLIVIFQLLSLIFPGQKLKLDQVSVSVTPHKNPQNPSVSVVIPAFNEGKFLARTLRSILVQDYKNFELIIVDNKSTDHTSKIAENFGAKVIFEPKQGVGFARQRGFLEARGKIIATTDADTILPSYWLSRIVKEFEKDQNLVAFGGGYTLYSGPITAKISAYVAYLVWILDKVFSGSWSLSGANLAIKKEAFLKAGGFRTELKLGEEADICKKLKAIGTVALVPDFLVQTSGRRFKNGLFYGLATYPPPLFVPKYRYLINYVVGKIFKVS
jgi:glycosyltransferase involved in cell wall biosynthesis